MAKYGTFLYGDGTLYGGTGTFPIENLVRVPWVFIDPVNSDEYEFAVNPLDASVPSVEKTVTTKYTTDGTPINVEGRPSAQTMDFSGTILYEEHFVKMNEWFEKSTQIALVDDLARTYWVVIVSFSPTRRYTPEYPWMHEYSCTANILSWS
jgi:hypothetical protein